MRENQNGPIPFVPPVYQYHATASESTTGRSRRKPPGWIPPTGYTFNRNVYRGRQGSVTQTQINRPDRFTKYTGPVGSFYLAGSDLDACNATLQQTWCTPPKSMIDKALIRARSKMKNGDVNLGIAFAERNRTAQLVTETATSIVKSLRALRRGEWRKAWHALGSSRRNQPRGRTIPQKWLEMQYGWLPLLSDVYGSVDALARQPPSNWIVTGTGIEKETHNGYLRYTAMNDLCDVDVTAWRGVFVRIDAVPENDLVLALASLGITNPALVAWELVPFSFMADWFLPIGSFLESLDAMLGYGDSWSSISQFGKGNWRVTPVSGAKGNTMITWNCTGATREYVRLHRDARAGVPLPTMPRLRDGRSLTRMANALSILASNMR